MDNKILDEKLHKNIIDLTGKRYDKLLVLGLDHKKTVNYQNGKQRTTYFWKCKCDCGNEIIRSGNCLRAGYTKSCGCNRIEKKKENSDIRKALKIKNSTNKKDLTGQVFGKLLVLGLDHKREVVNKNGSKKTYYYWKCACECGNEVTRLGESLTKGATKSCGCYKFYKQMLTNEKKKYLKNQKSCNNIEEIEEEYE